MSIIYNNQVVAGKYTQQVVADADTVNAGIIKIATEEQINEGTDNTTAVTPFYLAQKQDKISAGDGIVIDNNEISCTVNPDEQTIVRKNNGTMQCIGQLTKSNTLKFDWEGTQAEYNVAYLNGTIQPDWYCYIIDDEEFVDYGDIANRSLSNLKAEGEARFTAKADKATTLNGYGITDGLNKNQITNCLLEVPQNIKLELADGTLTLKAGSKVIVPNGVGVFNEITISSDKTNSQTANGTYIVFATANGSGIFIRGIDRVESGTTRTLSLTYSIWYDTINNLIQNYTTDATTSSGTASFPIALITVSNGVISSIDQVFNGFGYIGSTIWVDKGVKGLIPNGRNEDGALNNTEITTTKIVTRDFSDISNTSQIISIAEGGGISRTSISSYSYNEINNLNYSATLIWRTCVIGRVQITNSVITSLEPKLPFRAVDFSDFLSSSEISGLGMPSSKYIDLTLGASTTSYTAPANGWVICRRTATEAGQSIQIANHTRQGIQMWSHAVNVGNVAGGYIPVQKDDIFVVGYTLGSADNQIFRFIYAEGEN